MVTAHKRQELVKGAEELGIVHVLSKPVSSSLLVDSLMQMMGHMAQPASTARVAHQQNALEARVAALAGARILLVEDNEINQQVACELLRDVGMDVDVADNGQIAVHEVQARLTQKRPYDLVLMDMQMPVMDGVTATRLIRETQPAADLPIVAMTANAMKSDRERCQEAGMNGFVTKPIHPEELWKALLSWVKPRPEMGMPAREPVIAPAVLAMPALANSAALANGVSHAQDADTAATTLLNALREVSGLDVELGLSRTSRKPGFFASLLRKFISSQEDAAARITQCLQADDAPTAERLAHTLKGVAGNLGASALQESAERLEMALRQRAEKPALEAALQETTELLAHLSAGLRATRGLLPVAPTQHHFCPTPEQQQAALQALEHIKALLQADDATAVEVWETHAATLKNVLDAAPEIEAAIGGFDFEAALRMLRPASTAVGSP
jgi:two-component system sensor histidine kinase/response regulator